MSSFRRTVCVICRRRRSFSSEIICDNHVVRRLVCGLLRIPLHRVPVEAVDDVSHFVRESTSGFVERTVLASSAEKANIATLSASSISYFVAVLGGRGRGSVVVLRLLPPFCHRLGAEIVFWGSLGPCRLEDVLVGTKGIPPFPCNDAGWVEYAANHCISLSLILLSATSSSSDGSAASAVMSSFGRCSLAS